MWNLQISSRRLVNGLRSTANSPCIHALAYHWLFPLQQDRIDSIYFTYLDSGEISTSDEEESSEGTEKGE